MTGANVGDGQGLGTITNDDVAVGVCPESKGYWKSNPAAWPISALPMMLGTSRTYTKLQLLTILKTSTGSGTKADASLILSHQLMAAKLNIAAGAEAPAPVPATIIAADNAIGGSAIPMKIRTNTSAGKTMTSLASTLEAYNNGSLNAGCSALPKSAEDEFVAVIHAGSISTRATGLRAGGSFAFLREKLGE